jgi:hypothetical protein
MGKGFGIGGGVSVGRFEEKPLYFFMFTTLPL